MPPPLLLPVKFRARARAHILLLTYKSVLSPGSPIDRTQDKDIQDIRDMRKQLQKSRPGGILSAISGSGHTQGIQGVSLWQLRIGRPFQDDWIFLVCINKNLDIIEFLLGDW